MWNTKTIFLSVLIAIGLGIGSTYAYYNFQNKSKASSLAAGVDDNSFKWGILTNGFALNDSDDPFVPSKMEEQIPVLKDLGINSVLTQYESFGDDINDKVINSLADANFNVVLSIGDGFDLKDPYNDAYALASHVAMRYGKKINYYHLLNEINGQTLKNNAPGILFSDYDPIKYNRTLEILRGLTDGLKRHDPGAKRLISANWLGMGVIDKLISDGLNFEIVSWHWYSDMGPSPLSVSLEDGTVLNIPKHFVDQGKEFWLTEVNRQGGSFPKNEAEQAEYIKQIALKSYESPYITGFFVYKLTDGVETPDKNAWGIYDTKRSNDKSTFVFDEPKQAYQVYKDIISRSQTNKEQSKAKTKSPNRF